MGKLVKFFEKHNSHERLYFTRCSIDNYSPIADGINAEK